jgi:hypothetical protein
MEPFKLEKLTATNLAKLSADDFCPRCFWLLSRLNFKAPFSIFPKIFNDLDGLAKTFTESYYNEYKKLPPWLAEYEVKEHIPIPGYGKFGAKHECGIDITGVTDDVFRLMNEDLLILDYKTSRPSGDKMFPIYKTQLSVYAWIALRFGIGKAGKVGLVYYEPLTDSKDWRELAYPEQPNELEIFKHPEGIRLHFRPYLIKFETHEIDSLVLRAKELAEQEYMPQPNKFCTECARVLSLSGIAKEAPPVETGFQRIEDPAEDI